MDDESSSPSPSPSSSSSPLPISIARPSSADPPPPNPHPPPNPVTVASSSPHQILTLALPIQPPPGSSSSFAAGRDDCWSEGATSLLIDAWGERYLELSRGNLRQKQWQEVADAVSSRDDYSKAPKTDAQCKNRIDTLKKKYKAEKARAAGGGASPWAFFRRLDHLLGPTLKPSTSPSPSPSPALNAVPKKQRTNLSAKRKASAREGSSSPSSTSDSFPPARDGGGKGKMRELARAIRRFGEVYQRVESSKLQQSVEMERQRMEFSRELEEQRMRFFMKTQIELSQMKRQRRPGGAGSGGGNNHHRRRHGQQTPAGRGNDGGQSFGGGLM